MPVPWAVEAQPVGVELCPVRAVAILNDEAKQDPVVLMLEGLDRDIAVCEARDALEPFPQEPQCRLPASIANAGAFHSRLQVGPLIVEFMQVRVPCDVAVYDPAAGLAHDITEELPARPTPD